VVDFNRIFLYETGGTGIVGWFDVGKIIRQPIDRLWKTVGNAATSHDRFFAYFSTAREGYAIAIRNARRFQGPISANGLNGDRLKLQPPQSFIILEPGQPFWTLLESERQRTLQRELPTVQLKKITSSQRTLYKKQVMKHVGANYEGIDETFAEANLRIHDLGFDPAGFFTTRKEVLSINNERNVCIGFTTLTYKSGDCVKTGPTILLPRYRSRGYGQAARKAIEEYVVKLNVRKLYCTCPETSEETTRYLLASGMRVEAHLANHYSTTHNELVFGKLLVTDENEISFVSSATSVACEVTDPNIFDRHQLLRDFKEMFERIWPPVSDGFVHELLRQSVEERATRHHEKPKRLICVGKDERVFGAVVLLPKRGGAVKGLLLRNTNDRETVRRMLDGALEMVTHLGGRKLYFLHPIVDAETILLLKSQGFQAEGLLLAPYVPGQDVAVMSKFV
jgi:predicted transcriptional regulator/RimJ/RimL family protein N-acetyltransferase